MFPSDERKREKEREREREGERERERERELELELELEKGKGIEWRDVSSRAMILLAESHDVWLVKSIVCMGR